MSFRYYLEIEYDGTPFVGWQKQTTGPSVQGCLEEAFAQFFPDAVSVEGSGRTDAGVHARGQVAHVDLSKYMDPFVLQQALNAHLRPWPIAVFHVKQCAPDFHARFSAIERLYHYHIINRRYPLAIDHHRAWLVFAPLDRDAMEMAAKHLVGHHDFSAFRASACQAKSPVRTLDELSLHYVGDDRIIVQARARSFLHHQVRNMVGTLKLVGTGTLNAQDIPDILTSKQRKKAGPTAPAGGLYLMKVRYGSQSE
jgi:tRNA pseudouridine38-40 synthase